MKPIPISSLRLDGGTQQREHLDEQTIQDYADAMLSGATFPPIVAYSDGVDTWLADGFHRVYAAQRAKLKEIVADVRRGGQREARWASFAANSTHGLPRTRDDVALILRNIFADEQWAKTSVREIAEHTGIAKSTVQRHRDSILSRLGQYDSGERTFTHHKTGKPTTMKVANIGQRQQQAQPDMPDDMDEDQEPESETIVVNKQTGEVMDVDDVEVVTTTTSKQRRGSYDDWKRLKELEATVNGVLEEICTLRVDAQHKISARNLCDDLAERFRKAARHIVE